MARSGAAENETECGEYRMKRFRIQSDDKNADVP